MSIGLINSALNDPRLAPQPVTQHPGYPQPGSPQPQYAPDPIYGAPQMTASQAVLQDAGPVPPHMQQEDAAGVSFGQAIRGLHLYYQKFRNAEAAYNLIQAVLAGRQDPPIIRLPTGDVDIDGNQIIYELDLKLTLPERATEDERLAALRKQLGPWNNYVVAEYRKWLSHVGRAAATAEALLVTPARQTQQPTQQPVQQDVPGQRIIRAPQHPPMG